MIYKFLAMGTRTHFCSNGEDKSIDISSYKKILIICTPSRYSEMIRNLGGVRSGKAFRIYTNWQRDINVKWDCIIVDSYMNDYYEFSKSVYSKMKRVCKTIILYKGDNYFVKLNFK